MIHGIGIDIVEVARMQESLDRHGEKFARRVLGDSELEEFTRHNNPAAFLAKRFAVKEAAAKALGTGFRDGLVLSHITVSNNELGKPELCFSDRAQELVEQYAIGESLVSLSDEKHYAVAQVILLTRA